MRSPKPKKPFRIVTFCEHGFGMSPRIGARIVKSLSGKSHPFAYPWPPCGQFVTKPKSIPYELLVRGFCVGKGSDRYLRPEDLRRADLAVGVYSPDLLSAVGRSDLIREMERLQKRGRLLLYSENTPLKRIRNDILPLMGRPK